MLRVEQVKEERAGFHVIRVAFYQTKYNAQMQRLLTKYFSE